MKRWQAMSARSRSKFEGSSPNIALAAKSRLARELFFVLNVYLRLPSCC
jgi:hypothetical protein